MERYKRLFTLENNLYQPLAPIIIEAGALQLDTISNKIFIQLKFRSISPKTIIALQVNITTFDIGCTKISELTNFQYLDLAEELGNTFGPKTPIFLPTENTRSFSIGDIIVFFSDGSCWKSIDSWMTLPMPTPKECDEEYLKQYKIEFGQQALYNFKTIHDLWQCSCGSYMQIDTPKCYNCGNLKDKFLSMDRNILEANLKERLKNEQAIAIKIQKKKGY